MITPIRIRNVEIGAGMPKIIAPIVGKTQEDILAAASALKDTPAQMAEWRVDFFEAAPDVEKTLAALKNLRSVLGDIPLLFTFRTEQEGGQKALPYAQYAALNLAAAASGYADMVDVEVFTDETAAGALIAGCRQKGVVTVGSSHDFAATPSKDVIIGRLCRMQELGADILKIALMPQSTADVLTLLSATAEMHALYAQRPIVTMAMGPLGVISRIAGETFGSAMTFGALDRASAPGQIPVGQLKEILEALHSAL